MNKKINNNYGLIDNSKRKLFEFTEINDALKSTKKARELMKKVEEGTKYVKKVYQDTDSMIIKKSITNEGFLEVLKNHKFIIITGTSEGRKRIRELIIKNLGMFNVINTRRYREYIDIKQIKHFKIEDINLLQYKKKPVIIDSFSDFEDYIKMKIIVNGSINWFEYKFILRDTFRKIKKQKKQVIFFVDLKKHFIDFKEHEDIDKPRIWKDFLYEASFILNAKDESNFVMKDKSGEWI